MINPTNNSPKQIILACENLDDGAWMKGDLEDFTKKNNVKINVFLYKDIPKKLISDNTLVLYVQDNTSSRLDSDLSERQISNIVFTRGLRHIVNCVLCTPLGGKPMKASLSSLELSGFGTTYDEEKKSYKTLERSNPKLWPVKKSHFEQNKDVVKDVTEIWNEFNTYVSEHPDTEAARKKEREEATKDNCYSSMVKYGLENLSAQEIDDLFKAKAEEIKLKNK